jgi:hypothetical protein
MYTLTIEHAITDFSTWKTAFDLFSDARAQAGVVADRHPPARRRWPAPGH